MSSADLRYPRQTLWADYIRAADGRRCCAALPLLAARGQSLGRADPGGRLRAVRRVPRAHRAAPAYALRAGTRHALRRRPGRHAGRMEPARPHEAQLLLDQARPLRRLDAAHRGLGRRPHGQGRFRARRLLRYCRAGGAGGRDDGRRRSARRRAPISGRWVFRWRVRKRRYEGSAAGREPDRRVRRSRRHPAGRRQRLVLDPARRHAGPGRRIGLGQVGLQPGHHGPAAAHRDHSLRLDPVRGSARQGRRSIDIAKLDRAGPGDARRSAAARSRSSSRSR